MAPAPGDAQGQERWVQHPHPNPAPIMPQPMPGHLVMMRPGTFSMPQHVPAGVMRGQPMYAATQHPQRGRKGEAGGKATTDEEINLRKERNKVHAKRSRMRRKFLLDSLRGQLVDLRRENTNLRKIVKQKLGSLAPQIFQECCKDISPIFKEIAGSPLVELSETDQKLMTALQRGQQSFVLCSASLPGNTIIFASEGFLELTGYSLDQVLGRPALFLKGKGTSERDLETVTEGIAEGRDTTVCILAYKADGTAFWDQMFFAPLCDSQDVAIYFVGVHCDIEACPLDDELQNVVKKTSFSVMEQAIR